MLALLAIGLGTVCSPAATATGRPAPPRSFEVQSVSSTSVHLSWVASPGAVRAAGFRIYVNGVLRAAVRATSYRVGGLRCGTTYVLAVGAYDAQGRSSKLRSRRVSTTQCGESCFSSPGSCGYPDPAHGNVGVPVGTKLTPSGSITVMRPGTVIKGLHVTGSISLEADNVTIQNTRVSCSCAGQFAVFQEGTVHGLTIKNSEISGGNVGYFGHGTKVMDHTYMWNCDECVQYIDTIRDSYFYIGQAVSGAHYEAVYNNDGTTDIEHTVILNPHEQTADVFMNTDGGGGGRCQDHLTIKNSLLAGGGYTIYPCGNADSVGSATLDFENNTIARCGRGRQVPGAGGTWVCPGGADQYGLFPRGGSFGHVAYDFCGAPGWTWKNNAWADGRTVAC